MISLMTISIFMIYYFKILKQPKGLYKGTSLKVVNIYHLFFPKQTPQGVCSGVFNQEKSFRIVLLHKFQLRHRTEPGFMCEYD
jgi:hypothetical protein